MTAANSNTFSPTTRDAFCATTTTRSSRGGSLTSLTSLEEQYPRPNNSLVGLLTAAYATYPSPLSSLDGGRPRVQPLQPSQIVAIVDDVLRELDDEIEEPEEPQLPGNNNHHHGLVLGTAIEPTFLDLTQQ